MSTWIIRISIFLLWLPTGLSQENASAERKSPKGQFQALLRVGLTTSQIYGDNFGGYNKLGFTGGVGSFTTLSKNLTFQFELNYATRGSRKRPTDQDPTTYRIDPHYIDIPLLLKTHISFFEVEFGICNGIYLFHNESDNFGRIPQAQKTWEFNRYEVAGNLGINVPISPKWKANARFHYSLLPASGQLGFVNGITLYGGAYNNVITLSVHRIFKPANS